MRRMGPVIAALGCALLFGAAQAATDGDDAVPAPFTHVGLDDTRAALQDALTGRADPRLLAFYDSRDFAPVWSGSDDAQTMATQLRETLAQASAQGLRSADYTAGIDRWAHGTQDAKDAAAYDLAMTTALLRYARDVRNGRVRPKDVYSDVSLPSQPFDALAGLNRALKNDALDKFLADLPPPDPGYRGLVTALARYRAILIGGGWPSVTPAGKNLAQRLAAEDMVLDAEADPSDADVQRALVRFQARNGLPPDGKLSQDTLKALNISAAWRVQQILANMERWRWAPRGFERRYVLVNVPDQSLAFMDDGKAVLTSKVVIGKKTSPTPILRTQVEAVVANPAWDIPGDIAAKQLLPKLRHNADYLATRNMVVADAPLDDPHGTKVNWRGMNANTLPALQQPPGADNVLGVLMLDMPNVFDVYLHDTSNKKLFLSPSRLMSNGCVRVQEIFPLASLALTGDPQDGLERLTQAVAAGETQRIALRTPLPVYMFYWTAVADSDGTTGFRPDLYDRDKRLLAKLAAPAPMKAKPDAPAKVAAAQ